MEIRECNINCVSKKCVRFLIHTVFLFDRIISIKLKECFLIGKLKRDPNSVELANKIIEQYQPNSVEDMQNALKDIFGPMFESMLKVEMNHHLGYEPNDKREKKQAIEEMGMGESP